MIQSKGMLSFAPCTPDGHYRIDAFERCESVWSSSGLRSENCLPRYACPTANIGYEGFGACGRGHLALLSDIQIGFGLHV